VHACIYENFSNIYIKRERGRERGREGREKERERKRGYYNKFNLSAVCKSFT
jgi:hypothetical protein